MKCIHCGRQVNGLSNYGSDLKPSCYDCAEKNGVFQPPVDMSSVDSFLDSISFKKNTQEFRTSRFNYPFFIFGLIGFLIILSLIISLIIHDFEPSNLIMIFIFSVLFLPLLLIITLLGLSHLRTTINLSTRQIAITRGNLAFYKRRVTDTFALEEIQINAICFRDVPTTWMVRGGCGDFAFISKEFYSVPERNAAMLGILKKLFPEFADADESWIIEEGNSAYFKEIVLPDNNGSA